MNRLATLNTSNSNSNKFKELADRTSKCSTSASKSIVETNKLAPSCMSSFNNANANKTKFSLARGRKQQIRKFEERNSIVSHHPTLLGYRRGRSVLLGCLLACSPTITAR
mmetsp:Transcript_19772/g.55790  ORF Transcript_19772/g.55790 Transcript_19772/m.55790 type:complete len:110 (+) Transcript_19772:440-769(+)